MSIAVHQQKCSDKTVLRNAAYQDMPAHAHAIRNAGISLVSMLNSQLRKLYV